MAVLSKPRLESTQAKMVASAGTLTKKAVTFLSQESFGILLNENLFLKGDFL